MCSGSRPSLPPSTRHSSTGTWTPVKEYTDEEKAAIRQRAGDDAVARARAENPGLSASDELMARGAGGGIMGAGVQIERRRQQAAADAADLAGLPRQDGKAAQAPGRRGVNAAVGGGPSSLLTGGTAADALTTKKPRTGQPSLLGG